MIWNVSYRGTREKIKPKTECRRCFWYNLAVCINKKPRKPGCLSSPVSLNYFEASFREWGWVIQMWICPGRGPENLQWKCCVMMTGTRTVSAQPALSSPDTDPRDLKDMAIVLHGGLIFITCLKANVDNQRSIGQIKWTCLDKVEFGKYRIGLASGETSWNLISDW